jgi:hypothetical protein
MFALNREAGLGLIETLIAVVIVIFSGAGFALYVKNQSRAEYQAVSYNSQFGLLNSVFKNMTTREVLFASAAGNNTLMTCLERRGCSAIANRRYPLAFRTATGEQMSGPEGAQSRLYTHDGKPCPGAVLGTPNRDCPVGIGSSITVRCTGNCLHPLYVYAHLTVTYCPPGGTCNPSNFVVTSTDGSAGSLIGVKRVMAADCGPALAEQTPDALDTGRRSAPLSSFDNSFLFGFGEGFADNFPRSEDRDYSNYCRKLRLHPTTCDPAEGGVAIGITKKGELVCTSRTAWNPVAVPTLPPLATPTPTPPPGNFRCPANQIPVGISNAGVVCTPFEIVRGTDLGRTPQQNNITSVTFNLGTNGFIHSYWNDHDFTNGSYTAADFSTWVERAALEARIPLVAGTNCPWGQYITRLSAPLTPVCGPIPLVLVNGTSHSAGTGSGVRQVSCPANKFIYALDHSISVPSARNLVQTYNIWCAEISTSASDCPAGQINTGFNGINNVCKPVSFGWANSMTQGYSDGRDGTVEVHCPWPRWMTSWKSEIWPFNAPNTRCHHNQESVCQNARAIIP